MASDPHMPTHNASTSERGRPRLLPEPSSLARELVPPAGIEPATCPLGKGCSILLSYGGLHPGVYRAGARPSTGEGGRSLATGRTGTARRLAARGRFASPSYEEKGA